MKNRDISTLFEFVSQEVQRLNKLRSTDWKKATEEIGLSRGLPCNYDEFCNEIYECGESAARQLYEMAAAKLKTIPTLNGRVQVETLLRPIKVELAQRAFVRSANIDEDLVKGILNEAETRALATLEDRTYFFPVYTIDVQGIEEYSVGAVRFVRARTFLAENQAKLKRSKETTDTTSETENLKKHISRLFDLAWEHYGNYRWIAGVEIKQAEPDIGWEKAHEILELTLGLLRLSMFSRNGQFIGSIEENPTLRSASYLSLKATDELGTWHRSSYSEPHTGPNFIQDYRAKVPQLESLEAIILKQQRWEQTNAIEDRLLTALFWFSEAWKETRLLPKIIKFSTSVESLFSPTGDHDSIAEKIAERLAWLSFPGEADWQKRRDTYRIMKAVYSARSKAVHGDSAVKDLKLGSLARNAEELAALGIFAFSQLPPLFQDKMDREKLLNEFFVRLKLEGLTRALQIFGEDSTIS